VQHSWQDPEQHTPSGQVVSSLTFAPAVQTPLWQV
jgi:hypothetical protein